LKLASSFTCFVSFALLCLFAVPAMGQVVSFTVEEKASAIEIQLPSYRVSITKEPYSLALVRGTEPVARSAGGFFVRNGARYALTRVKQCRESLEGISLSVGTNCPGVDARISMTFFQDNVLVQWSVAHIEANDRMGENFLLEASGHWYGGNVTSGHHWPLETGSIELDPFLATSNQTTPFWLTSRGAGFFVPTYQTMGFSINKNSDGLFTFNVREVSTLEYRIIIGDSIIEAYDTFTSLVGRPQVTPPRGYFAQPIFNTWIELKIDVNQADVLRYAETLRQNEFPCDVFMIDDRWQRAYGDHEFDPEKFPDPKAMIDRMHELGFRVILWVVPFVHDNGENYGFLEKKGWLVRDQSGRAPCRVRWWNGEASLVDLSNPEAFGWFVRELKALQENYGVDGFKLDGGDAQYFKPGFRTFAGVSANRYTDLFAQVGAHLAINEYRVSWLVQNLGLVQRLRDKNNNWSAASGLGSLIPHGLTESLIGYAYFCPDIIGGGLDGDFRADRFGGMDRELFVRWTQASALMPMMQFSFAPWNLDEEVIAICRKYADLHVQLGDYIYGLAQEARRTGRPIIQPLFFRNPEDQKTYTISNEFMLGERFLVAPVLTRGAASRDIYLPAGLWKDFWSGEIYQGRQTLENYPAPLEKLPVFVSIE
jgi:alpha-glucosidase (family GH31 glycosyl hydrolase)